nr:hypothetical protein Iba_chr08bCG10510 [Ipomoea batatas]
MKLKFHRKMMLRLWSVLLLCFFLWSKPYCVLISLLLPRTVGFEKEVLLLVKLVLRC